MSITSLITRARQTAESLMTDHVKVERINGVTVDPETGLDTSQTTLIYDGKARVQTAGGMQTEQSLSSGSTTSLGGRIPTWSLYIHLPWSVDKVRNNDKVTVLQSSDPQLVGKTFRCLNLQSEKTYSSARRLFVQEIA